MALSAVISDSESCPTQYCGFLDLPDDVLFLIFSYLPLKVVLLAEQLCQRLKQVVSSYLTTLKNINLYNWNIVDDVFKLWDVNVAVSGDIVSKLLQRCTLARSITYIPLHSKTDCKDIVHAVGRFSVRAIEYVDSKDFFDEVQSEDLNVTLKNVYLSSTRPILVPSSHTKLSAFKATNVLYMEDVAVDFSLLV